MRRTRCKITVQKWSPARCPTSDIVCCRSPPWVPRQMFSQPGQTVSRSAEFKKKQFSHIAWQLTSSWIPPSRCVLGFWCTQSWYTSKIASLVSVRKIFRGFTHLLVGRQSLRPHGNMAEGRLGLPGNILEVSLVIMAGSGAAAICHFLLRFWLKTYGFFSKITSEFSCDLI